MALLKLLLSLGTIIAVTASPIFENSKKDLSTAINNRLSDNIKPIHYNIEFILNIEEGIYYGKSNVSIKISKETEQIELHSMNLAITKSTLIYKDVQQSEENRKWPYKPSYYSHDKKTNIFIIHFSDKLLVGNYILNMEFFGEATNDTEGLFRTSYNNERGYKVWLIATHLQTIGARQLFPCWDEPKFKATFTISVKHLMKYTAFSNMPVKNLQKVESNMMWTHFRTTPIMPPNFMAIAVIDFIGVSHNWNVKIWYKEKEIYKVYIFYYIYFFTHLLTLTLENEWCMLCTKMIPKVDYIVIPDFPKKVAITWGLILYREDYIIDKEISLNMTHEKIKVLRFIAYNIAQESLNNIPPWLIEGFARLLEIHIIDKNLDERMMDMLEVQIKHESFRLNSYFNEILLEINNSEVNSLPSSFRYHKAFPILRMLQYLLTDKVFREGIKNYLNTNKHSTNNRTALNDFWIAMQNALDKSNENKINLIEKMDDWTKQKNYPVLKLIQINGCTNILLKNSGSIDGELWIPMTYTTQNNPDFSKTSFRDVEWQKFSRKKELFSNNVSKLFKEDGWIIINLQQTGYYRVNYDTSNWKKIAKYLNSIEYTKIHVLNRAQIIDDAFYFLTTNQISPSVFWELINYLERETDYVAWYPMIKILEHMSSIFLLSDPEIHEIKEKLKEIFNKVLENIGYEESYEENKNYFINCLRQEITKWACLFDEFKCKIEAGSKLQQYLANHTENKLLAWWEEWTYCNGLMVLDNNVWHYVYNSYVIESNDKYLKFLACSERIMTIKDYGSLILEENGPIKNKYRAISFHYIIARHAKNNNIFNYILATFEKITLRVPMSAVAVITNLINHIYSEEQLRKIYQFISKNYMKHMKLHVQDKIKRRSSEITNILNYFRKLFPKNISTSD